MTRPLDDDLDEMGGPDRFDWACPDLRSPGITYGWADGSNPDQEQLITEQPTPPDRSPADPTSRWIVAIVVVGIVALSGVALIRIWTAADRTLGDLALIELEVRRTFTSDSPLLGAYSRFGWRHPGPIAFYLLAPPYRLFGSGAQALATAAVLLNTAWLLWAIALLRRRGSAAVGIVGSSLLLMVAGLGLHGIGDAWNVSLSMVPFAVMLVACWGVLCGDRLARLPAALAYLFVVHSHIGVGVVATPLALATVATVLVSGDLRKRHRPTRLDVGVAAAGLVAVAPAVVDAGRRPPGNLAELVRWSLSNDLEVIGFARAARLVGRASSLTFPARPEPPRFLLWVETDAIGLLPGFLVGSVVVLGALAWRRGRREEAALSLVVAVAWLSGLVAARSVPDPPEWWQVQWLQPLGWMTAAATGLLVWRLLVRPNTPSDGFVAVVGAGVVSAAVAGGVIGEIRTSSEFDGHAAIAVAPVDELADAVAAVADGRVVRLDTVDPDFAGENMLAGVVNEAVDRGIEVCVDARLAYKFGESLACVGDEQADLLLRTETVAADPPEGYRPVTVYDPLSPETRRRADVTRARLADALRTDGRAELIGTLDTPLAAEAVLDDPGSAVAGLSDEVLWLDAVRERPGLRFGLYERMR